MTALGTQIDFMKLWQQSDQTSERKLQKFLLTGLDRITKSASDTLAKLKVGPSIATPVVRWMEQQDYPTSITGYWTTSSTDGFAVSGYLFGEAASWSNMNKCIRVGTILERASDGAQVKVSAIHASALTFTCATYGNSPTGYDSGPVQWDIISEPWSDYKDVDSTRALDFYFREVGTEIFAESFEIPKTRQNTKYEHTQNETEDQIKHLLEKLRRQMASALIRSRPYYASTYKYGNQTETSTLCGLHTWPAITQAEMANTNVYVNASTAEISKTYLDNLVKAMWLEENSDFNTGDWWIACHPNVAQFIHDFEISYREKTESSTKAGFSIEKFDSKIGKTFPILVDPYFRPDVLQIVDFSKLQYGYYANDRLDRKELSTQGRYQRWLVSFQLYGLVVRKPRQSIGTIYGLATSM